MLESMRWRWYSEVDVLFSTVFSSQTGWEVHLTLASDKLIQVLESQEIHGSTSECMTAKLPAFFIYFSYIYIHIFIYRAWSLQTCPIYPFPWTVSRTVRGRSNIGCRTALWLFGGGQPRKEHRGGCHAGKPLMMENGFRIEVRSSRTTIMEENSAFCL